MPRTVRRVLAAVACLAAVARADEPPFRPPAVPLVTADPYLSIWSEADHLTDHKHPPLDRARPVAVRHGPRRRQGRTG